jgi:RNA polymerase sigma-70 factor (ECF subfamily)
MAEDGDASRLVARARSGERAAFDELVSAARERLLGFVRLQMGQRLSEKLDPEDVIQEVFLCGYQSAGEFRGRNAAAFCRWLEGIARNVVRNHARRHGVRKELQILREPAAGTVSPSRHQRRKERFDRLSRSVEGLSPDYQTVIRLARIDGLKINEIAERMDRSPSAIKNLLLRAMRQLKRSFGDTESLTLPDERLPGEGEYSGA